MLQLKIKAGRRHIPIFDLPAAVGRKAAYEEIGDQVDALIAFMDDLQGDVDLEDGGDDEPDTDAMGDQSWPEWHTLPAQQRRTGNSRGKTLPESWFTPLEDDEDSDPPEDSDAGEDDDPREDGWDAEDSYQPAYNGPLEMSGGRQAANDA